jgi:hypothetical protein
MHSTISRYLMQARQDDAARAGERDRVLLEARRLRLAGRLHARPAGLARRLPRRLVRLLVVSRTRIAALRQITLIGG